ncbi:MAG: TOBE-like domain-containing protein, partial [Burkholderiaceae bacterium]|nr:TOBE-like domain-containing protein [Burkholderiaceae bacterium]
ATGATGIAARLNRAIVVGPIARLELIPEDKTQAAQQPVIEVQIPASQYRELGLTEGELLVVTPRKARVFVEGKPDLVAAA